jgi:hypothetical protein
MRVMASLTKIRRSVDWNVKHPNDKYPPSVPEHERLDVYDTRVPLNETLENWLFTVCLKNYLLDANAVVLIAPVSTNIMGTEYLQPFPIIYNSPLVVEFKPDELLIVKQTPETEGADGKGNEKAETFLVVTTEFIQRWERSGEGVLKTYEYRHNLGVLPAYKVGGQYFKSVGRSMIYESRISPMLPRLNDAAREYSDLQAEVVQHIHSEKWVWANEKCPTCRDSNGFNTGFVNHPRTKAKVVCPSCNGNLKVASSPYLNMVVRPTNENLGETPAPLPPAGYITKPIDIVKIQDERIDKHLYKALASINFQFLDQTPLNISGVSKEVDRDELNNFVYSVAEDLVRVLENAYKFSIEYRYGVIIKNESKRREIRPQIKVPEKFDLLNSNYLTEEIERTKKAGVSGVITASLEVEYAGKKFYSDPTVRELVQDTLLLDPLAGVDDEVKMLRLSNGGVSKLDYIISSNITQFVRVALERTENFITMTLDEKFKVISELAKEKEKEINALKVTIIEPRE